MKIFFFFFWGGGGGGGGGPSVNKTCDCERGDGNAIHLSVQASVCAVCVHIDIYLGYLRNNT